MGKMKDHPRYNVVSCRVDNDTINGITDYIIGKCSVSCFLLEAIQEKIERMNNERKTSQK